MESFFVPQANSKYLIGMWYKTTVTELKIIFGKPLSKLVSWSRFLVKPKVDGHQSGPSMGTKRMRVDIHALDRTKRVPVSGRLKYKKFDGPKLDGEWTWWSNESKLDGRFVAVSVEELTQRKSDAKCKCCLWSNPNKSMKSFFKKTNNKIENFLYINRHLVEIFRLF